MAEMTGIHVHPNLCAFGKQALICVVLYYHPVPFL
jgi:hypothetical protein